jgi:inosine-uridine nucleoside N-ribohydrolase
VAVRKNLLSALTLTVAVTVGGQPEKIIFDTDITSDCDDTGALAVLHTLADRGEAEILAVTVSARDRAAAAAAAVSVINTYYGRPEIPIGTCRGAEGRAVTGSVYTAKLRDEFPHGAKPDDEMPPAVGVLRRTLAAAPDASVSIVAVGFLGNLRDLLQSPPDADSDLDGAELARKKVRQLVVMGGAFPRSDRQRGEFNFACAPAAAKFVAEHWPTPVLFSGFEIGANISTGKSLTLTPEKNPVRRAYELFGNNAAANGRPSWDLTAALAAARAPATYWTVSDRGTVTVSAATGANEWSPSASGRHFYLIEKTPPAELAKLLDELLARPPKKSSL